MKEFKDRGMHFPDSLHAAIAIAQKCDCIVTFNIEHFEPIKDRIEVVGPIEFD